MTTDICLFTVVDDDLRILLVRRGLEPFKGAWALPGGFLQENETLDQCAARELQEETGVAGTHLEAFATFSEPKRDPRYRVVTAAYFALVPATDHALQSGSDADDAQWHRMQSLPKLAFDHADIITAARGALAGKLDREPLVLALLPARFTLTQIQKVYEAVEGQPLDKRNFRRAILAKGWIRETGAMERGSRRPAMLYERA
ncbi:NUDIX hydrolase [Aestuariivirga litoralis]|uniref:NUDIX hydrolase n=1 Tax=Aestuariivirga litoralis TaxID=2650924 RepID=UPI00195B5E29|nr:NUDIX hydrolase [Aestuariivirga litoralis]